MKQNIKFGKKTEVSIFSKLHEKAEKEAELKYPNECIIQVLNAFLLKISNHGEFAINGDIKTLNGIIEYNGYLEYCDELIEFTDKR